MRKLTVLLLILVFGCKGKLTENELPLLNGYWEISEVIFPDGNTKEYGVNTSVDFIKLEDQKGYRKKVQPKFDGTFDTSNDADMFVIIESENGYSINYTNDSSSNLVEQRSEQIVSLSESEFTVRNLDGLTYRYKRFEPINIQK
ncbi:hypothetical protein JQC67_11130 [Aurantibacter crassamenti]|uniref:hypothetical protein n=1 Tax=Aurantibacter crassamenti TaxID=1837375 RepID=UPI00193A97F5|nr:hypothetical protein [Aurantibacter crassamenti]MBM1106692.1 hypothetical protein [Aurantibacter crassamenti]